MKNRWKIRCICSQVCRFFSNWGPSRNTVFYRSGATSSFFYFSFFLEKMWKNESKIECRKIIEEIAPTGTQNESKTDKKWRGKPCKSRKITKKRCFWKGGFLMIFWVAKKSKKGGITIIDGWVLLAPGLQWGTIGGTIQKSFWLSNTPLGRWPGELLLLLLYLEDEDSR